MSAMSSITTRPAANIPGFPLGKLIWDQLAPYHLIFIPNPIHTSSIYACPTCVNGPPPTLIPIICPRCTNTTVPVLHEHKNYNMYLRGYGLNISITNNVTKIVRENGHVKAVFDYSEAFKTIVSVRDENIAFIRRDGLCVTLSRNIANAVVAHFTATIFDPDVPIRIPIYIDMSTEEFYTRAVATANPTVRFAANPIARLDTAAREVAQNYFAERPRLECAVYDMDGFEIRDLLITSNFGLYIRLMSTSIDKDYVDAGRDVLYCYAIFHVSYERYIAGMCAGKHWEFRDGTKTADINTIEPEGVWMITDTTAMMRTVPIFFRPSRHYLEYQYPLNESVTADSPWNRVEVDFETSRAAIARLFHMDKLASPADKKIDSVYEY
jgi:hypothetical protein